MASLPEAAVSLFRSTISELYRLTKIWLVGCRTRPFSSHFQTKLVGNRTLRISPSNTFPSFSPLLLRALSSAQFSKVEPHWASAGALLTLHKRQRSVPKKELRQSPMHRLFSMQLFFPQALDVVRDVVCIVYTVYNVHVQLQNNVFLKLYRCRLC